MTVRNKKPKCTAANKACGMACKPKAAICADQRKKLVTNAKKSGLKGQAAKDYVQARIDRYKKLVDNKGAGGVGSGKKPTDTVTSTSKVNTPIKSNRTLESLPLVQPDQKGKKATSPATPPGKDTETRLGTPVGQMLRQPLQNMNGIPKYADADITAQLVANKKNVSPVFVSQTGKDSFNVVGNASIAAAAKRAKLDFAQTVVVDEGMAKQLAIESKQGVDVQTISSSVKDKPNTGVVGLGNPLGQIIRQPVKFIKGRSSAPAVVVNELAAALEKSGKNVAPVYVHEDADGNQRVVGNAHILDAAKKAKLDFIQTVVVDKKMAAQLAIENKPL
jgi:hypothetical protein